MRSSYFSGVTFVASCSLLFLLLLQYAAAGPACPHRNEIVPEDISKCKYGVVLGWCGNLACGKGPGDVCGGRWEENGNCGKGMYCLCGHCAGCSSKLKCVLGRFC